MHINELITRLQKLTGVDIPRYTIKQWAFTENVIPAPKQPRLKGRHYMSDWPDAALEGAAAVWAVRERWREIHGGKRLPKKKIDVIKRAASTLNERPFAVYLLPPITGPLSSQQRIAPEDIKMRFVSEDFAGLDLFPGADNAKKAECLNELIVAWVAAVEKVRAWESEGMKDCIMEYHPNLAHLTPAEIDFSQIDPWRVEVPCPWRIDEPARIELFWGSRPAKNRGGSAEFWKFPFPFQRALSKSERNDIILVVNLIDTREFFKIDVTDSKGHAKAELKEIARKLPAMERKMRRLGLDETIRVGVIMEMEKKPFETLTAREKLVLKTAHEWLALVWRQSRLKTWCSV